MSTLPRYPIFEALLKHDPQSTAIVHCLSGRSYTYGQLVGDISAKTKQLAADAGRNEGELRGERVAMLIENSYDYVVNLLSIMASDAIAVPLSPAFPAGELRYVLDHSEALMLLSSAKFADKARETLSDGLKHTPISVTAEKAKEGSISSKPPPLREISDIDQGGLMLYTSGTTSRPKGVLLPTATLNAQSESLQQAWSYTPSDHLLHVLPLHHIHGVVNAILTPLLSGSTIEFLFPFSPATVWSRLAGPFLPTPTGQKPITFFTVVPTVYNRLLSTHSSLAPDISSALTKALHPSTLRLNISGSAALPTPTKSAWTSLTGGNILLERYGMTEVGMALSCGLDFSDRLDGSVGWPLPGVEARLASLDDGSIVPNPTLDNATTPQQGEIQLRGPTIFKEYWRNPSATASSFTEDGWFKTGDVGQRVPPPPGSGTGSSGSWAQGPVWQVLGRASADIIKTGGEKISALEVERELLSLPNSPIAECAVVGLPSQQWGQKVAAVVVLSEYGLTAGRKGGKMGIMDIRRELRDRLAMYKIPQDLLVVEQIPRNAMGKVNKVELVKACFGDEARIRRRSVVNGEERERLKREAVEVEREMAEAQKGKGKA
ncbi:acetyl-CoA synthetase-like protein [Myriangium duriaei CBS 260.36]|uniref:Acetyl-CoA synthetase-like protein n=1 Tax=Myriangium duriaei CBS 260.36 TaxID=1168546 RepID=A0A9P4IUP2_9PEZI|nr:acetyl-CoA synthetase-like protein [Myriangium duriaei CBS 260.36]